MLIVVIPNVLHVWFYAVLTNIFEVATIISFLQMKKLRYGEGLLNLPKVI